jgi:hypothetical protein
MQDVRRFADVRCTVRQGRLVYRRTVQTTRPAVTRESGE